MATYCIIRGGELQRTIDATVVDGTIAIDTPQGRMYLLDAELAKADGVIDDVTRLAKAMRYDEIDAKYFARLGANPSGLTVMTRDEWDAEYKRQIQQQRDDLAAAVPGLDTLKAAIADHNRYHREFTAMMEDGGNDGARPPKKATADLDALRREYPRAAAYLKAEAWQDASHYAKSGAGRRAKARIVAGDDIDQVLADMEREWSEHCTEHAWD